MNKWINIFVFVVTLLFFVLPQIAVMHEEFAHCHAESSRDLRDAQHTEKITCAPKTLSIKKLSEICNERHIRHLHAVPWKEGLYCAMQHMNGTNIVNTAINKFLEQLGFSVRAVSIIGGIGLAFHVIRNGLSIWSFASTRVKRYRIEKESRMLKALLTRPDETDDMLPGEQYKNFDERKLTTSLRREQAAARLHDISEGRKLD